MLKEREKVIQARTPAPKRTVAGEKPVLSHRDVKPGVEIHRVNIDSIFSTSRLSSSIGEKGQFMGPKPATGMERNVATLCVEFTKLTD